MRFFPSPHGPYHLEAPLRDSRPRPAQRVSCIVYRVYRVSIVAFNCIATPIVSNAKGPSPIAHLSSQSISLLACSDNSMNSRQHTR